MGNVRGDNKCTFTVPRGHEYGEELNNRCYLNFAMS